MTAEISSENVEARGKWYNIFKVLKKKNSCPSRMLYVVKIHFRNEREVKTLPDDRKLRGY